MSAFYILSVKKITRETHNSVSITFNIPESLKERFTFIPGQYVIVQKELNGETVRRDYSICSSVTSGEIKIGVKAVENGTFSQFATTQLKEGDELEVSMPHGRFNLHVAEENAKNYVAFAAGSGITPVLSMVKSALAVEPTSKFVLVYGNKTIDDVMFKTAIDNVVATYGDRFFVHYVFSKTAYDDHLFGRIDTSVVNLILKNKYAELQFSDYFLCGPEAMINLVKETIQSNGVANEKIHFELFSTSAPVEEIDHTNLSGETEITIVLDDEEETFTMKKKNTILDSALLKGLDAPYSCQGGICSSCLAKITEGKAVMDKNTILSDEEIILTCQAHPTTAKITIDYDDV
mgnify:FL=1